MTLTCPKCTLPPEAPPTAPGSVTLTGRFERREIRGLSRARVQLRHEPCGFTWWSAQSEVVTMAEQAGLTLLVFDEVGERPEMVRDPVPPIPREQMSVSVADLARRTTIRDGKLRSLGEDA